MSPGHAREPAVRITSEEFNDIAETFVESDEEFAPRYALLPTGVAANRVLIAGTLVEAEDVGNDGDYWRGKVADPAGTFYVYAGEYQPECMAFLRDADTPSVVAVIGKPRTFEDEEGVWASIRPEIILEVDTAMRDRWLVEAASATLDRVEAYREGGAPEQDRAERAYGTANDMQAYIAAACALLEG